jgi:hypothetical protein
MFGKDRQKILKIIAAVVGVIIIISMILSYFALVI